MTGDAFAEALTDLLGELIAPDPVTRARAGGEIGELFEANSQPPPPDEPRYYSRNVRPALRARTLTEEECTRIVSFLRDLFLARPAEGTRERWGGRAWHLKAMEAAPPPFATETLAALARSAWDTFDANEAMVASLALSVHLVAWRHAKRSELAAALERTDALEWLTTLTEGMEQRDTMCSVRDMVASLVLPEGARVPPGARFRVQLGPDDGFKEVVHVWASDEEQAAEEAAKWIWVIERGDAPHVGPRRVERIGDEPDPTDLGIAERNDEVHYRRYDADGRPRSTLLHVEIGDIERLTNVFRTDGGFARVREALESEGVDPMRAAAIAITPHADPRKDPLLVIVVASDGSVRTWRGGPGWDQDDITTLEEHWRRWMRVGRRYLDQEESRKDRH